MEISSQNQRLLNKGKFSFHYIMEFIGYENVLMSYGFSSPIFHDSQFDQLCVGYVLDFLFVSSNSLSQIVLAWNCYIGLIKLEGHSKIIIIDLSWRHKHAHTFLHSFFLYVWLHSIKNFPLSQLRHWNHIENQ